MGMPRLPRVRRPRRPRLLRRRRSLRKRRRRRKRRSKLILLEVKQRKQPLLSPKNIPDWFLFFLESQRFAVLKTKWLCIFYVKLYCYIAILRYCYIIGFLSLSCNKQNQHSWYGSKHSQWKILLHQKILVVEFV